MLWLGCGIGGRGTGRGRLRPRRPARLAFEAGALALLGRPFAARTGFVSA
jgi:hypothetical protein